MKKKCLSMFLIILLLAITVSGCLPEQNAAASPSDSSNSSAADAKAAPVQTEKAEAKVLRIGSGVHETSPTMQSLREKFKVLVEEYTEGRYTVELYPGSQLGDDTQVVEGLRAGTMEMSVSSTGALTGLEKKLGVFDIPFLFNSYELADAIVLGDFGNKLKSNMIEKNLVVLTYFESGFRDLCNNKRPVVTPKDVTGLKLRVMDNQNHIYLWNTLKANPTPMGWSEVFISIESGVIDGADQAIAELYNTRIFEIAPYISTTNHIYNAMPLLFSKPIWDKIDPKDQDAIQRAANETAIYQREIQRAADAKAVDLLRGEGATVTVLTPEQKKAFQDATESCWTLIEKTVGEELITELKKEIEKFNKN